MTRHQPLILTAPTRFAGLPPRTAIGIAAAIVALILVALAALAGGQVPVTNDGGGDAQTDLMLYAAIVDGLRAGGRYYTVAADALRAGGYPLRPFVAFRLPTLAVVQAALPPFAVVALLWTLVAATLLAWARRLFPAFLRAPGRGVAVLLLLGGSVAFWQVDLAPFHELWAGLFVALSLALWTPGDAVDVPVSAIAFAMAAMLIRETAVLFAVVMTMLALIEGRRREAASWGFALLAFAIVVVLHARAVGLVLRPLDPESPGWTGMLGFGFFVRSLSTATALSLFPGGIAAPLVVLALVGWAAWRDALGLRMVATLGAYALLLATAARADTFYWALMIAPASLAGLAFVPDAVRDLAAAALDRRRITVRRVIR